jgi:hypothetical protein
MIIKEPFRTREDGVDLFITLDALIDENGNIVRDKDKKPVLRGFYIKQLETGNLYDVAIDTEGKSEYYTYVETDKPIETEQEAEFVEEV